MAKHRKKADPKAETREIVRLDDFRNTGPGEAHIEYEDEESGGAEEKQAPKKKLPKAAYRVAVILAVLVLVLALWFNRANLSPENVVSWFKLQLMGSDVGDGFPVAITGSSVAPSNFTAYGGDALTLSDTALTLLDSSGKERLSLRHSLNQPAMRTQDRRVLLYNQGSTGYLTLSGGELAVEAAAQREILAGAISHSGKFALGLQGAEVASELNVYQKEGDLQYQYQFAKDYITAVALNYDGTFGLVCTVRTEKGELVSKVTVLDFSRPEPIAAYETRGNLLLDAAWTEGGDLYAVGDSALLTADSSRYEFTEHSYEGRQLTAYHFGQGRAFLSISAYEHAGPSTLLVYRGDREPVRVEAKERIVSLSTAGGVVGALVQNRVLFLDYSTGSQLGETGAGSDAKSIALHNERKAYVLGVSEIRTVEIS